MTKTQGVSHESKQKAIYQDSKLRPKLPKLSVLNQKHYCVFHFSNRLQIQLSY